MKAIDIIKQFECCKLQAYKCPAGRWTIGWGTTIKPDGTAVKHGDIINQETADFYLNDTIQKIKNQITKLPGLKLNSNQLEAIISFVYNIGIGNFKESTLYKKAIINPNDPTIKQEFARWNKVNGKEMAGLTKRRKAESDLYFI